MRKQSLTIYERDFMFAVGGVLYEMAPDCTPRNGELFLHDCLNEFRTYETGLIDEFTRFVQLEVSDSSSKYSATKEFFRSIFESSIYFEGLNMTGEEYAKLLDDEGRKLFRDSIYSTEQNEHDFIDLDAFTRNVVNAWEDKVINDADCFLCNHQRNKKSSSTLAPGTDEECKNCIVNGDLVNNFTVERSKETCCHKDWCKFDCPIGYAKCCKHCDNLSSCQCVCDGDPKTCGNYLGD